MGTTTARLSSACFHVSDLERSLSFYRDVFDMVETARWEPGSIVEVVLKFKEGTDAGGIMLMWDKEAAVKPGLGTGYSRLVIIVPDIGEAVQRTRAQGCEASDHGEIPGIGIKVAMAKDPDGYVFELVEGDMAGI